MTPPGKNHPPLKWFEKEAERLELGAEDSFLMSYPHLLRSFEKLSPTSKTSDFVLAVHAVYGWMPTMLDLQVAGVPKYADALVALMGGDTTEEDQIDALNCLKGCIGTPPKLRNETLTRRGESIVGLSKFLHFLEPGLWPIWDNRVKRVWPIGNDRSVG